MAALWLLGIILFVLLIVALARSAGRNNRYERDIDKDMSSSRNRALDILDERYARGEMDKTEYEQKRRDIERRAG